MLSSSDRGDGMRVFSLWIAVFLMSLSAAAEVKIKLLDDGSRVMYNEGRTRRTYGPPSAPASSPAQDLEPLIAKYSAMRSLDPDLVRAVIQVESGGQSMALSNKGAMGLMQLMPGTARQLAVDDPYDAEQNVSGGTQYLSHMLDLFNGSLELALSGYNAGPEAVNRYGGIPPYPETRSYVEKVLRLYRDEPGFTLSGSPNVRVGRKTYLSRGPDGHYVMTTTPVGDR
jgi:soluble lytic murein transglycosylase-like protein